MQDKKFFAAIYIANSKPTGHAISFNIDDLKKLENQEAQQNNKESATIKVDSSPTFATLFERIDKQMRSYRDFLPITLAIAPQVVTTYGETHIAEYIREKGQKIEELEGQEIYELDISFFRSIQDRQNNFAAAHEGALLLPNIIFSGLVSLFDAFMFELIILAGNHQPSSLMSSDASLKIKEILTFDSIEKIKDHFIQEEANAILHKSHLDQIKWISSKFDLNIDLQHPKFKEFAEICERRNIIVHTGGVISDKYLKNCAQYDIDVSNYKVGDILKIDRKYFENAVRVFHEVAAKICYITWRQVGSNEDSAADSAYNQTCFDLIRDKEYGLAISLLSHSTEIKGKKKVGESVHRMMVVNLANAHKLNGSQEKASKILDQYDWSANEIQYRLSVAAVKNESDKLIRLMREIGKNFEISNYIEWPVFHAIRDNEEFRAAISEIYSISFDELEKKAKGSQESLKIAIG